MYRKPNKKKGFKVGTYYQLLGAVVITSDHSFPRKIIWRTKAPLRVTSLHGLQLWVKFLQLTI